MRKAQDLGALKLASETHDENVPVKRADFFCYVSQIFRKILCKFKKLSYINE